MTNMKVEDNS